MTRSRSMAVGLAIVAVVLLGGYVAYDQVLRGDTVGKLTLPSASTGAGTKPSSPVGASSAPVGASTAPAATFDGVVAGTWTVASGSRAGYRVTEQLANLPAQSAAVGRTSAVTGSIKLETSGVTTTLTDGLLTVNTAKIASDKPMRDNRMRNEGLQTDSFRTASFKLAAPVTIPAAALTGSASDITLTGDLTLHGVTKSVQIPAQAQLVNGTIQVAGSITFPLADYSIVAPNVGGFIVSIADEGALEFQVNFAKG